MGKYFNEGIPVNRKRNDKLYKLFNTLKCNSDIVHDLSENKSMPLNLKNILSLGLKYCVTTYPNFKSIESYINEGVRKIAWCIFFKSANEQKELSDMDKWFYKIKKKSKSLALGAKSHCDKEDEIFVSKTLTVDIINKLKRKTDYKPVINFKLIQSLKTYCTQNDLVIMNADKNAGICIMNKIDYDNEIISQLSDTSTYYPSTLSHFYRSIDDFTDKLKHFEKSLLIECKLSSLIPERPRPAKFYILPKIHKKFDKFPKGRPISSTIHTYNKPISQLLDRFLQPIMLYVPDLLLDTTHLLVLLNNVNLAPSEHYSLVTIDI